MGPHPVAVVARGIGRRFGSTVALDAVDLELRGGEIHALLGENGAGKTTLVRILAGLDRPDDGEVTIGGDRVVRFDPRTARQHGIALVQQHFTLVPTLTAAENLVLARPTGRLLPRASQAAERLEALARRYDLPVRPDVPAGKLSVGEQQRLELLRALDADASILLLDEPTAVLTDDEAERLLAVCRGLAEEGRSVVVITHRLAEVFAGCDRVSVLRAGRLVVGGMPVAATSRAALASAMVGAEATGAYEDLRHEAAATGHPVRLEVRRLRAGRLEDLSLAVRGGEILGVAGVDGNGQADLEAAVSGRVPPVSGDVLLDGEPVATDDPRARIVAGLAYIPSDRYRWGLVRPMPLADNIELGRTGRWRARRTHRHAASAPSLQRWDVRSAGPSARAASLSGGNAQKLVLARELGTEPRAVLACYPTRGLDPEAARTVVERVVACAEAGAAVLWIGAELDELFAVADRVVVMFAGRALGPFERPFDRAAIGLAMAGVEP